MFRWPFLLIAAAALLLYSRTLSFDFIMFDDMRHIYKNPQLNPPTLSSLADFWTSSYRNLFIPLTYTAWGLVMALALAVAPHSSPAPFFHAASALCHLANGLLVYLLLRELLRAAKTSARGTAIETAALVGALVFVCHPLQVEAVAWVSGFSILLSTTLGLGALLAGLRAARTGLLEDRVFVFALYAGALLAKPQFIALPFAAFLIEAGLLGKPWRRSLALQLPQLALAATFALVTSDLQPPDATDWISPLWLRPFEALRNLGFYAGKVALPAWLSASYPGQLRELAGEWSFWAYALFAGLGLAAIFHYRRRQPIVFGATASFVLVLAPVLGLFPFYFQYYSETSDRYVYQGIIAVSLLAAWMATRHPWRRVRLIAVPLLLAYVAITMIRVPVWRDDLTAAQDMLNLNRRSISGNKLMSVALERKTPGAALKYFAGVHERDPEWPLGFRNLLNALASAGRTDEMLALYENTLQNPALEDDAHYGRGNLLILLGRTQQGINELKLAGGRAYKYKRIPYAPGHTLLNGGHLDRTRARESLEKAAAELPDYDSLSGLRRAL